MIDERQRVRMILASAGSGKTYSLTSRMIGLLALGTPPEEILASTFTRKAAGEILDRILRRLAEAVLDEAKAAELRGATRLWVPPEQLTQERCGDHLLAVIGRLHTLRVGTLDAFFHTIVRSFALELGLSEGWTIADEADLARLRSLAVERALDALDPGVVVELVRMVSRGAGGREVHALLLREVQALHEIYREIDPSVADPWGIGPWESEEQNHLDLPGIARRLEGLDLRSGAKGTVHASLKKGVEAAASALREERWIDLLKSGVGKALLDGKESYYRWEITPEARELYAEIFIGATRKLGAEHHRRIRALGRFLPIYDRALRDLLREEGIQGFSDLTDLLLGGGADGFLEPRDAIYYRLDARIRHILLDEFQDTSNPQWRALAPIVEEIRSQGEEDRSVLIVADPKQSIYGWRGGEPRIFGRIRDEFAPEVEPLTESWRSSPVVLEAVNRVFTGLAQSDVLQEAREIATVWAKDFAVHSSVERNRGLPGHVTLEAAPPRSGRGRTNYFPPLLDHAATRVRELHTTIPGATIGVLTQTNRNAEHIVARLRRAGIEASGEGGVPVVDSAPVLAILALLRMADHPGDRISRYLAARTPLGALVGLGPEDWKEEVRVAAIAARIRRRLLEEGYGKVLREWANALLPELPARDAVRVRQLVDLASRWEERATLRPADFVRMVEGAKMEDPSATRVRVMTIHRAKGLEFDIVILPDLDGLSLTGEGKDPFLPLRAGATGEVCCIVPRFPAAQRPLFHGLIPEVVEAFPGVDFGRAREAASQARERELRDALGALYVGMTRARYSLHLIVEAVVEQAPEAPCTAGALLRSAFAVGSEGGEAPGDLLATMGESEWWRRVKFEGGAEPPASVGRSRPRRAQLPITPRRRLLPLETPSALEGGGRLSLADLLPLGERGVGREDSLRIGSLVHAWLAEVEWLETTGLPPRERLLAIAADLLAVGAEVGEEIANFETWVAQPEIQRLLSCASFPEGTQVERELPFLARDGERLLRGSADRVLRVPDPEGERLVVIDWKTDRLAPSGPWSVEARTEYYAPQVRAYMRGLSTGEGIHLERAEGWLAFLRTGEVVEVPITPHRSTVAPPSAPGDPSADGPPGSRVP